MSIPAEIVPLPPAVAARRSVRALSSALAGQGIGGRLSADNPNLLPGYTPNYVILPPDAEGQWRSFDLDLASLDRIDPSCMLELLADLSPELSRALWDLLLFCNPGWDYELADEAGVAVANPRGQAVVDAALAAIAAQHGSLDVAVNRLNMNAILRGALFGELVLDEAGRAVVGLGIPDAATARFRRAPSPTLGVAYELGQLQLGFFVPLDRPTIAYLPVHPFPGSPYGRAPLAPGIFPALFRLGLLRDIRRVVAQQGWPRLDLSIDTTALFEELTKLREMEGQQLTLDEFNTELDNLIKKVADAYGGLPPDGAYVHTSDVTINRPVGAVDASSLGAVDGLMQAVERAAVQSLKTHGFMMSMPNAAPDAQSIRQAEAYYQTIRAFQHATEAVLSGWLTLALRAQGIPGKVVFRFAENRASEEIRDLQAEQLRVAVATAQYQAGWISQDEAAKKGADKDKADVPAPRAAPVVAPANPGSLDGQPQRATPSAPFTPGEGDGKG